MSEDNLADQVQADTNVADDAANESTWQWAEELPGTGEKPDWFIDSKYQSVAEQAKGYKEMQSEMTKKLGAFTGAPDEYEVNLPEDLALPEGIDWTLEEDDPMLQAVLPVFKEMQVSQEGANQLIKTFIEHQAKEEYEAMQAENERSARELASIPEGQKRVSDVAAWAKSNMPAELFDTFKDSLVDANSLQMVEKLISMTRNSEIPTNPGNTTGVTRDELDAMYKAKDENGEAKYHTDKAYRERVQGLERRYFGS